MLALAMTAPLLSLRRLGKGGQCSEFTLHRPRCNFLMIKSDIGINTPAEPGFVIGVDLGGTKIAVALADCHAAVVAEVVEPTDTRGAAYVAEQIVRLAKQLCNDVELDLSAIRGGVIGVPGAVSPKTGRVSLAVNVAGLDDFDLARHLAEALHVYFSIENDANLALIGEMASGTARNHRSAALITVGTGVGMGFAVDGQLVRGANGSAGEVAYLPIGRDLTSQDALRIGAFELEVGSRGIVSRYRACGHNDASTVREIFDLAEDGSRDAQAVIRETARWIALGILAIQSILDLEVFLLGGSIGARAPLVLAVQHEIRMFHANPPPVLAAELGTRAGLTGAIYEAMKRSRRAI